jgi:hypothetical protein
VVGACGVVVSTAGGIREREVGVIYELEFAGSFGAFWGIGWDAVGVGFEGCSRELLVTTSKEDGGEVPFIGISNLLRCCCGGDS